MNASQSKQLQIVIESPMGPIYLAASERGLTALSFSKIKAVAMANAHDTAQMRHLLTAQRELKSYFAGRLKRFSVRLDTRGTTFQASVWSELRKIPFGKTCSYGDLAKKIGNPKAMRAVGTANGCNPIGIIVPCHRVIAADGTLGGYSGGIALKAKLLKIEGSSFLS